MKRIYPWVRPFALPSLEDEAKAVGASFKATHDGVQDLRDSAIEHARASVAANRELLERVAKAEVDE